MHSLGMKILCMLLLEDLGQKNIVCVYKFFQGFQKEAEFEISKSHIIFDGHCCQDVEARAAVSKHAGSFMHSTVSTSFCG